MAAIRLGCVSQGVLWTLSSTFGNSTQLSVIGQAANINMGNSVQLFSVIGLATNNNVR